MPEQRGGAPHHGGVFPHGDAGCGRIIIRQSRARETLQRLAAGEETETADQQRGGDSNGERRMICRSLSSSQRMLFRLPAGCPYI